MRYYITTDILWLEGVNSRGLGPSQTTRKWVELTYHPSGESVCASIPESYLSRLGEILTAAEEEMVLTNLKTRDEAVAAGFDV